MKTVKRKVLHKVFGEGTIVSHKEDTITVEFADYATKFSFTQAFEKGHLTTDDEELTDFAQYMIAEKNNGKNYEGVKSKIQPIVFCNISWMTDYLGKTEEDIPVHGGSYIDKHKDCNESFNFLPITDMDDENIVTLLGSYETKSTNGTTSNQTHIEKIIGCNVSSKCENVDGVTVVWCATAPEGGSYIVGWYKDATVYRRYRSLELVTDDYEWERWYNIICEYKNAVLLPVKERLTEKWEMKRTNHRNDTKIGFGQSNIWYAESPAGREFAKKILDQINSYNGKNELF